MPDPSPEMLSLRERLEANHAEGLLIIEELRRYADAMPRMDPAKDPEGVLRLGPEVLQRVLELNDRFRRSLSERKDIQDQLFRGIVHDR